MEVVEVKNQEEYPVFQEEEEEAGNHPPTGKLLLVVVVVAYCWLLAWLLMVMVVWQPHGHWMISVQVRVEAVWLMAEGTLSAQVS